MEELRRPLPAVGTVVSGEASESDNDDDDIHLPFTLHPSLHGITSLYNISIC